MNGRALLIGKISAALVLFAMVTAAWSNPPAVVAKFVSLPLSILNGGLGNGTGDASHLVVIPRGQSTPVALPDVAARAYSQPSIAGGGLARGHIAVGGDDPFQIYDSGVTMAGAFNKIRNPGPGDDYFMGYISGSFGYNQFSHQVFVCTRCDIDNPGAAVWVNLSFPLAALTTNMWSFPSLAANSTTFLVDGGNGVNTNSVALAPLATEFSTVRFHVPSAPGVGHHDQFTLIYAPPGTQLQNFTVSNLGCTISDADTDCKDLTHKVVVPEGNVWTWQAVNTGNAISGQGAVGFITVAQSSN